MQRQADAQSSARRKRGVILCILALFLSSALVYFPFQTVQAVSETGQDNQPAIVRVYNHVVDWTAHAWQAIKNWVIEQSTQIARAFSFWSKEPALEVALPEPQVLGEKVSQPLPSSPLTSKTELIAPVAVKTAPAAPPAPTETTLPSEPTLPEPPLPLLGKEGIPSEPAPAPTETSPTQPEIVPTPKSTPEVLSEPIQDPQPEESKQQSSSYFIPILARDTIPPASSVSALATTTASNIFTVSWTGEDTDTTGSPAVQNFDIQYQVDSGDWTDWLLETVLLSSSFETPLAIEKTYGFRSRARDRYSNLENYPDSADASIYVNLLIPVNPSVTSHSSGATLLSTAADEDSTSGSTVQVTLSGDGEADGILTIFLAETATTATTTIDNAGHWSKQFTLAEGVNNFTLQSQEADGDNSNSVLFLLNLEMVPTHDVVINEIAWMGTTAASNDEWIELYNASSTAISLAGWTLAASDGTPNITLTGTIGAKSYFLLERTSSTTVSNIAEDQIYTGALGDGGELLTLRQANGSLVDKAGSVAGWFAGNSGTDVTMERKDPTGDGTLASNWANNDETLVNGQDSLGANLKGTPKSLNSQNTTIPRVVTNLQQQYIYTTTTSVRLYWTTPKFSHLTTSPTTYDLRYSTSLITESNFATATSVAVSLTPSITTGTVATSTVSGLATSTPYYFAIKTNNGVETSGLSNVYTATTENGSYTQLAGWGHSGDLTLADSPYLITANITVDTTHPLTVRPGVVVKMKSDGLRCGGGTQCAISVNAGGVLSIGSSDDAINAAVITSSFDDIYNGDTNGDGSATTPAAGDWNKITLSTGTSSLSVNHGIIAYGGFGGAMITINAGTQSIANSIIRDSSNHGVIIGGATTSLTLSNSIVRNTLDVGLGITSSAIANVQGSTFTGSRRGISVDTPAVEGSITITGNNFYANNATTGDPLKPISGLHYADVDTLTAKNNWWGSASGPTTSSPDDDAVTDAAMATGAGGVIDYTSWAASAFSILPSGL